MSRIEFAPIVYSRTYEVDFRFIVVPEDFQQDSQPDFQVRNRDWVENHIHSTTLLAERLPDYPRWSIFKNTSHCIVGVTCMATAVSEDKTRDRESRPLYLFLGYVFRSPVDFQPIPMELEHFKTLYHYVSEKWEEKLYETTSKAPILKKYQEIPSTETQNAAISLDATANLNFDPNKIRIWPDSEEFRQKLWLAACAYQEPVSLCLGLPNEAAALKGSFLNSTILDFNVEKDLDREQRLQQRRASDQGSASLAKVTPSLSIDVEPQGREPRKRSNPEAEAHLDEPQALPRQPHARGQGRSNRHKEDGFDLIGGIKKQISQGFRELLRASDPYTYEDYADEDIDSDEDERLSPQPKVLENYPNKSNTKKRRGHVQDTPSEPNKGIDIGFKPKEPGQDDSKNSEDWF